MRTDTDSDRDKQLRHVCLTLDLLQEETYQLYISLEAQVRLAEMINRRNATLKRSRAKLSKRVHSRTAIDR